MGKVTQIASATMLAAFAALVMTSSAQAASGGKTVCIKPHKKFLKTQCGFEERRHRMQTYQLLRQNPNVNFRTRVIVRNGGPDVNGLGSSGSRGGSRGGPGGGFGGGQP